ncbi:MAG: YceD family protein [Oryzihumus sp.]
MDRLDPRQPLVFDTKEVGRRPGSMAKLSRTVEAPADLGSDVIAVQPGQPVELELRMESVMEGVLVTGSARATATGACVRCLDPVSEELDVTFQELFAYADRAQHHHEVASADDDDDEFVLVGDLLDLEPVLRDAVVPALPFQPVCREDCPGLCSECGAHLADDPDHHHETLDPRWAALQNLTNSGTEERRN